MALYIARFQFNYLALQGHFCVTFTNNNNNNKHLPGLVVLALFRHYPVFVMPLVIRHSVLTISTLTRKCSVQHWQPVLLE